MFFKQVLLVPYSTASRGMTAAGIGVVLAWTRGTHWQLGRCFLLKRRTDHGMMIYQS